MVHVAWIPLQERTWLQFEGRTFESDSNDVAARKLESVIGHQYSPLSWDQHTQSTFKIQCNRQDACFSGNHTERCLRNSFALILYNPHPIYVCAKNDRLIGYIHRVLKYAHSTQKALVCAGFFGIKKMDNCTDCLDQNCWGSGARGSA
jgi:hypothetical protein